MKVEPGLVSVKDLLLKAHSGDWSLWLPSFQRRFVWDPVDIKAFFDSLLKGNPVGILLLWRSKNPEGSDPFALRVLIGEGKSSENFLIVDGQQRVLSLLLLLNGWHVKVGDKEYTRQPISFNPTKFVLEVCKRGLYLSEGVTYEGVPWFWPLDEKYPLDLGSAGGLFVGFLGFLALVLSIYLSLMVTIDLLPG